MQWAYQKYPKAVINWETPKTATFKIVKIVLAMAICVSQKKKRWTLRKSRYDKHVRRELHEER
ncbi:hypothetical protein T10_3493 [Trichinella papuae]|uniref:Uncharacterized protein n=1 Tax=Trichinella papuae TaxID=268474 RepID=A0A0V1LYK8_9BILA|nr:hypothetical protein T10_3493 [Trichinella papuae]